MRKQTSHKTCGSSESLPVEGKGHPKHYFVYPEQERMEAELCKRYNVTPSKLHARWTEFEYYFHVLGNYMKNVLQHPIRPPPPGETETQQ